MSKREQLSHEDYRAVLGAALPHPNTHLMIRLLAATGLRISEVVDRQKRDVSASGNSISVIRRKRQRGYRELMPVNADVAVELSAYLDGKPQNAYLFPSPYGGHITPRAANFRLAQIARKVWPDGSRKLSCHMFRWFFVRSVVAERGIDTAYVAVGHSSPKTIIAHYNRLSFTELAQVVNEVRA